MTVVAVCGSSVMRVFARPSSQTPRKNGLTSRTGVQWICFSLPLTVPLTLPPPSTPLGILAHYCPQTPQLGVSIMARRRFPAPNLREQRARRHQRRLLLLVHNLHGMAGGHWHGHGSGIWQHASASPGGGVNGCPRSAPQRLSDAGLGYLTLHLTLHLAIWHCF